MLFNQNRQIDVSKWTYIHFLNIYEETSKIILFLTFCHSFTWFNSSKKASHFFHCCCFCSSPAESFSLLFSLLSQLQSYKWELDEAEIEKAENERMFSSSSYFSSIFHLHVVLPSPHLISDLWTILQTTKYNSVKDKRYIFLLCSSYCLFVFEEDSLFCVVNDDQLFISVSEERRWSSFSSID